MKSEYIKPQRYFIHGATGTGKTLFAYKLAEKLNQKPYIKKCSVVEKNIRKNLQE